MCTRRVLLSLPLWLAMGCGGGVPAVPGAADRLPGQPDGSADLAGGWKLDRVDGGGMVPTWHENLDKSPVDLAFSRSRYTFGLYEVGSYSLGAGGEIDMRPETGSRKGMVLRGRYRASSKTLAIATTVGDSDERPRTFDSRETGGRRW